MAESPGAQLHDIVLEVEGLKKTYAQRDVLSGVSFRLRAGEALGVIGPSGAGKSTLLKLLDILEPFDAGSIRYFDSIQVSVIEGRVRVTSDQDAPNGRGAVFRAIREKIGFVFQGLNLWEDRSVMDNLVLAPTVVLKENHEAAQTRARELCRRFSLLDKADSRVWQLSGGQRQRVAIVRALMMRPKLMLLDEITSALDPGLVLDVMDAIRSLWKEGISFILVTHHIEFASSLCHRIMFMQDGQVIQIGPPEELQSTTVDERVRKFCEVIRSAS